MIPIIDKKKTGIHLRKIMDARELSVKDVQQYLGLGSVHCQHFYTTSSMTNKTSSLKIISIEVRNDLWEEFFYERKDVSNTGFG